MSSAVTLEAEVLLETETLLGSHKSKSKSKFAFDDPQTPQLVGELPPEQGASVQGVMVARISPVRVQLFMIARLELAARFVTVSFRLEARP